MARVEHLVASDSSPAGAAPNHRTSGRRRFSRTLSRGRWTEYERLLGAAVASGYELLSLEPWLDDPERSRGRKVLLLRHDVDQHPRSARRMADIERDVGATSTWYFRWRTADGPLIADLRERGHAVGLHYETLSRQVRGLVAGPVDVSPLLDGARDVLRGEIAAFSTLHGAVRSVCPHGDTRVPGVRNADLLRGEDLDGYGVVHDAHLGMRRKGLGYWLTDRSQADGGWKDGADPHELMRDEVAPVLVLVHPNNWVSGPGLWADRLLSRALPFPGHGPGRRTRVVRTGTDAPPI